MSQQNVQETTPEWEVVDNPEAPAGESGKVAKYSPIEAGLAQARKKYENVAFDLTTTKGNAEARAARKELVTLRTTLERTRKEQKAPALAYIEKLDGEAARIKQAIVALEDPIDAQIKADETRREQEKAERERLERERLAGIRARIQAITVAPVRAAGCKSSADVAAMLRELGLIEISETLFGEFVNEAQAAYEVAAGALERLHASMHQREQEEARLEQQRQELARQQAELERQRAEQQAELERQQREAAERLRREQEELEAKRQEQQRVEAAQRAEREQQEAAERERREAEAAELKRQQDAFEEEKRQAREKLEAERAEIERKRAAVEAPPPAQPPAEQSPSEQPPADDLFSAQMPEDDESTMPGNDAAVDIVASAPGVAEAFVEQLRDQLDSEVAGGALGRRPTDLTIVNVLATHFDVDPIEVVEWIESFDGDVVREELAEGAMA